MNFSVVGSSVFCGQGTCFLETRFGYETTPVSLILLSFLVPMTLGVPLDFLISLEPCKIFLCSCHFRSGLFAISFVERGFD